MELTGWKPERNELDDLTLLSDKGNGALEDADVSMAAAGILGISYTGGIPMAGDLPSIDDVLALDDLRLFSPQLKYAG